MTRAPTGAPAGGPFTGHTGPVNAVAVGQLEGRTVVVSGRDDRTVRVWDAATGAPAGGQFTGHTGPVNAVAVGQLEGRTVVVSGRDDQTVRVWAVGTPAGDLPWRGGKAEVPPSKIDLAASALGIVFAAPSRFVTATELGIVSLRMPISYLMTIDRIPLSAGQLIHLGSMWVIFYSFEARIIFLPHPTRRPTPNDRNARITAGMRT